MANNYTHFSFAIALNNEDEREWVETVFHMAGKADEFGPSDLLLSVFPEWPDQECLGFDFCIDQEHTLHIFDDAGEGNGDSATNFIQAYLKKFDLPTIVTFSTAFTCSKPRPGEFGGVAIAVSKDGVEYRHTYDIENELATSLRAGKWGDDKLQFARLLSELVAAGIDQGAIDGAALSMDLEPSEVQEVLARAEKVFESAKKTS